MNILVLNCGSSSIKYQLFEMDSNTVKAKGIIDKIGMQGAYLLNTREDGDKVKLEGEIIDHQIGIEYVLGILMSKSHGSLDKLTDIDAVGHRVVHGGERFKASVYIDDDVIAEIERCSELAPLHNPPNLKGIYAIKQLLPDVPQCAVFDTAFHQTMQSNAYMYALPYSLYEKYGVRRYGFHGASHRFVSKRACEILNLDYRKQKIITCHLGNGASIAAIKNGNSIDTSMGLTPVEGLIMGTRTGDVDAGSLVFIMNKEEIGFSQLNTLINKHSGLLGISGISSDMRELTVASEGGNERAKLALAMYSYRVKKFIGSYMAALNGVDMIIFTGGIGENASHIRNSILKDMEFMGIDLDESANKLASGEEMVISKENSNTKVLVVPTNEELVIAEDTLMIIKNK